MNRVHFSSKTEEWVTPQPFFNALDREFRFTLDACAKPDNAKCSRYFSPQDDAFSQEWIGRVWMNPPYGRAISRWIQKAHDEVQSGNAELVVCLVPARTETAWFQDYCLKGEVRFVRGRLKFSGHRYNAPFPCAVVIFRKA